MPQTTAAASISSPGESILLANEAGEMHRLYEFVEALCERHGFSAVFGMEIQLALEETLVNVINYAHPGSAGRHLIELAFSQQGGMAQFVITDDGVPFDPTRQKDVDIDAPIDQRQVGGLGIHLVRNLMDTMRYRRHNGRNILTLGKKIAQE